MASPYNPGGAAGGNGGQSGASQGSPGPSSSFSQSNVAGISLEGHNPTDQADPEGSLPEGQQQQQCSEYNIPVMCRIGLETVQEIVSKATDVFHLLRSLEVPVGSAEQQVQQEEIKSKLNDTFKLLHSLFRRLRRVYEICDANASERQFSTLEPGAASIAVPLEEERRKEETEKKPSEGLKALMEERYNLEERVYRKNKQLKEIIDMLRSIVWEINSMLIMRKKNIPFAQRLWSNRPNRPPMF